MIVMSASYPYAKGKKFDETYYVSKHIPLVREVLGDLVKDVAVYKGLPGLDGGDPAFFYRADMCFASMEDVGKALSGPRVGEMMADTANYTDVESVLAVCEK
jgi:uncharacterized protein (TIGR02118 family)